MSFTKVAPAGIGTEPGSEIKVGDSLLHSTGIDLGSGTGIGATITRQGNATFSGIITATSFKFQDGSSLTSTASALQTNATGTNLTLSGNLGVGGVLTYEDVTNVDSIGIITARSTVSIADSIIHTGDTNTSLAGCLAASIFNRKFSETIKKIKIVHVEAGLRAFDEKIPEEINRRLIDQLSNILFPPTTIDVNNIRKEE